MKSERERQIPYDITYMWDVKYDTNEPIYKTETDSKDIENRHGGRGWTGSLGLVDANYYIQNG